MANLSNINNKFLVTTGGDVGIGTTSPQRLLQLRSTNEATGIFLERTSNYGFVQYNQIVGSVETYHLGFVNNNTFSSDILVANESGNVGINKVDPSYKLDVEGDVRLGGTNGQNYPIKMGRDNHAIYLGGPNINTMNVGWDTNSDYNLHLNYVGYAGGVTQFRNVIINNGKEGHIATFKGSTSRVGIGTDGPQALLDVEKNNSVIYNPADDLGQRSGTATIHITNQTATINTFGQLMYDSRTSGQGIARIVFLDSGPASVDMAFVTENSDTKSEKMRIASNGNVGIGTDDPQSKLEVATSDNINDISDGAIQVVSSSPIAFVAPSNLNPSLNRWGFTLREGGEGHFGIRDYRHSSTRVTIDDGGNVGIGTTTPGYPLEVNGRISISSASAPQLLFFEPGRAYTEAMRLARYEDKLSLTYGWNANEEALTVVGTGSTAGYVGIRTINPDSQLHVKGISTLEETTAGAGTQLKFVGQDNSGQFNFLIGKQYNVNNVFEITPSTVANGGVFSTPALVVNSSGKVGMGTTSPSEKLTIPGNYGVGLGYKTFYSSGGTVPAGIGPSNYLVATLNQLQGTTLTSRHQYKFFLTTTGTGTYNSSVYIVYANSNDTAWQVREVSRRGTVSNHPELTVSGTEARIYNDHPSSYGILYRVETTNSGQANTAPDIFGSDYMWQRTGGKLSYTDGEVVISAASYSDGANNISLQQGLVKIGSGGTGSTVSMYFTNPNGVVGSVVTNGSNTQFNTSSDYRLKEDLQDFNGLDKVSKIPVYDFKWKVDESRSYGVIAHELQEVLPDAVSGEKDTEEMQGVDYSKIVPLLVKSIQELKAEIELLKSK